MSNSNQNSVEQIAVGFVDAELQRAQTSLRRARIYSVGSVLFMIAYMTFIGVTLYTRLLQPKPAAEVATHYLSTFVQENGTALSQQLVEQVPALVARAPDMALAQLPVLRMDIEQKIDKLLTDYSRQLSPRVGAAVDDFLIGHQQEVHEFIAQARDPEAVHALGMEFEEQVLVYLHTKGSDGASAMDRLASGVEALQTVEQQLHRLAVADKLTPEEKQTRRLIGLIMQQVNRSQSS